LVGRDDFVEELLDDDDDGYKLFKEHAQPAKTTLKQDLTSIIGKAKVFG
jgi:hypothetical protein